MLLVGECRPKLRYRHIGSCCLSLCSAPAKFPNKGHSHKWDALLTVSMNKASVFEKFYDMSAFGKAQKDLTQQALKHTGDAVMHETVTWQATLACMQLSV